MPLWAKVDVDMPADPKLFGQPVATRWLWLCLITLAKQQNDSGAVRGYDCALLAGRFNMPRRGVADALTHYQSAKMVELDQDGTIRLLNFVKRQGSDAWTDSSYDKRCRSMLVYFIQDPASGLIKIGTSKNPWARLSTLQKHHGSPLHLLGTIKSAGWDLEAKLHRQFATVRRKGEWFEPVAELVAMANSSQADVATVAGLQQEVEQNRAEQKEQDPVPSSAAPPPAPITELESEWPNDLLSRVKEAITSTRKSGAMAEGPWRSFLLSAKQFTPEIRAKASNEYLDRACATEGKGESYLIGIMRGETRRNGAAKTAPVSLHVDNEKLRAEPSGRKML